jgi:hypothetical protein
VSYEIVWERRAADELTALARGNPAMGRRVVQAVERFAASGQGDVHCERPTVKAIGMIPPHTSDGYWQAVHVCLTRIHRLRPAPARDRITALRTRLDRAPAEIDRDLFYHAEPFDVAQSLSDQPVDRQEVDALYREIMRDSHPSPSAPATRTDAAPIARSAQPRPRSARLTRTRAVG